MVQPTVWEVRNETEYAADRAIVLDKSGERHWVVVVKGTFDILPDGTTRRADEQMDPLVAPEYRGDPGASSLLYEQDFTLAKPRTDVVLNATAHAVGGRPAPELTVGIKTPAGTKSLVVRGDRTFGTMEVSVTTPFVTMPIVYERTYGGHDRQDADPSRHRLDPRNPIGTGFSTRQAHRVGKPVPNIGLVGAARADVPAGYGALCSYWEPRVRHQGTYDAAWVEQQKPLLPKDWDPQVLQYAPVDQQFAPHLRGGEIFGLHKLTPSGSLQFALPKHYFGFTTEFEGPRKGYEEHRAKIHSVIIEPDHPRVIVVWHTILSCHHKIDDIVETLVHEKQYV
jgi:hypothetical protein